MICAVDKCNNEAKYEAVIKLHVIPDALLEKEKENYKPAEVKPGVVVCEHHTNLTAYDILTEERFTQLTLEIHKNKGSVFIDRDNLEIEWTPIKEK